MRRRKVECDHPQFCTTFLFVVHLFYLLYDFFIGLQQNLTSERSKQPTSAVVRSNGATVMFSALEFIAHLGEFIKRYEVWWRVYANSIQTYCQNANITPNSGALY